MLIAGVFDQQTVLTRATASIGFGYYNNRIKSFGKVIKSLIKSF